MKEISLTQGFVCKVDDEDYEALNRHKWHVNIGSRGTIYARRTITAAKGKRQHLFMHCELMGVKKGDGNEVDHRDRDGLNNQRDNLRVCLHKHNSYNRKNWGESQYKGVSRAGNKWRASADGRHIGTFDSELIAAEAYDDAAREMAGEYAALNFPERQPTESQQGAIQ